MKFKKLLLLVSISVFLSYSCKKDNYIKNELIADDNGRLSFESTNDFENLMRGLQFKKDSELQTAVLSYTGRKHFISFAEAHKTNQKELQNKTHISLSDNDFDEEEPFDELVPDPYFASVLNENLEIIVENALYKVTPFGTFIISPEKYDRLLDILSSNTYIKTNDYKNHIFYQNKMHGDFYKIEDKIILLDTYKRVEGKTGKVLSSQTHSVLSSKTKNNMVNSDDWIYDNIPTIYFGAKTWAGKLFESLRGREEIYTENFESTRRVRVNFYNASWGVYSAIGSSVKMQKKNWIGWSGTAAHELRLGWDALEYYIGQVPSGFGNLPHPTYQYFTPVDLPKQTKNYVEVNLLGYNVRFDKNKEIQRGAKELFDWLKNGNVPGIYPKQQNVNYAVKVWADFAKTSISIVQERDEAVAYNAESISKVFDWAVGAKISSNFEDINISYAPLEFTLDGASVYGIAKYGASWRGARIITK